MITTLVLGMASAVAPYTVIDLGALPGGIEAWAFDVNDAGQVAVTGQYDGSRRFYHALRWRAGQLDDLGQLGSQTFHSFATALNQQGQVVGGSPSEAGGFGAARDRAFFHDGTQLVDLGALVSGGRSFAFDVNDAGDVVGLSETGDTFLGQRVSHAVLWTAGEVVDLGTLGGTYSCAHALNASGAIVGTSLTDDGPLHAFLWSGAMSDLGTLGGAASEAWDVNDAGQIVGWAHDAAGRRRPFLFATGVMRDLGTPSGMQVGEAFAVNAHGQAVGTAWSPDRGPRAVLWSAGQAVDLNECIGPFASWKLQAARAINASGWIVGYGRKGGRTRAFLLVPANRPPLGRLGYSRR